mgnify:CR=1 FL=1
MELIEHKRLFLIMSSRKSRDFSVTFSGRRHIGNWIVAAGCKKQAGDIQDRIERYHILRK